MCVDCAAEPAVRRDTYDVIADPPFAGVDHATVAWPFPGATVRFAGAPGMPIVTAFDAADIGPVPTALWAATRNVYALPLARPVTISDVLFEWNERVGCACAPRYGVTR